MSSQLPRESKGPTTTLTYTTNITTTDSPDPLSIDLAPLPKISLHDHLDGGLRPATILELAAEVGHELPADTVEELTEWFTTTANSGSLVTYLTTFDHTTAVMQTASALQRVAREFVEDLIEDGVIYGEVRWAPEQHQQRGLSLEEAVEAVQTGLDEAADAAHAAGIQIHVQQILCAMRHADRAQEIAELAVRYRDSGVAGFDIAGAEDGFPANRFTDTFTWLTEQLMPITVHAGEAVGSESISDALVHGRALRIGHGVHLSEDFVVETNEAGDTLVTMGRLSEWIQQNNTVLELCPSSNLQTGAVEPGPEDNPLAYHPFGVLADLGFAVTVNPDNRLISGVSITDELYLLAQTYDYTLEDLLQFQLNAAHGAFVSPVERTGLIEALTDAWGKVIRNDWDDEDPEAGPSRLTVLDGGEDEDGDI